MEKGYVALILHAHLPFVRHPEYEDSLEENWLYEAITETYVRLFLVLESLIEDGIDFRLTFSLTPTLASVLLDPFLQDRYLKKLDRSIELAKKEIARTNAQPDFRALAVMHHKLFLQVREAFVDRYNRNLVQALKRFQELGKVEVLASAATHGYLPLLSCQRIRCSNPDSGGGGALPGGIRPRADRVTPLPRYYGTVRPYPADHYFRPRGAAAWAFSLVTAEQVLKFHARAKARVTPPVPRTPHGQ